MLGASGLRLAPAGTIFLPIPEAAPTAAVKSVGGLGAAKVTVTLVGLAREDS